MNFFNKALEYIFLPSCGVCGKIGEGYLCAKCGKELGKYYIVENNMHGYNINNINNNLTDGSMKNVDIRYIFQYKEIIRKLIIQYKFNNKSYLYKTFCEIIAKDKKVFDFIKSYDIIIPVPAYPTKKWERGYNQTECIIRELGKKDQKWKYDFRNFKESEKYKKTKFFKKRRSKNQFTKCI